MNFASCAFMACSDVLAHHNFCADCLHKETFEAIINFLPFRRKTMA